MLVSRTAIVLGVLVTILVAQREEKSLDWQKRTAKVAWNGVQAGRHKMTDLQVGQIWRMGRNDASHLTTDMALIVDERVIVPGSYRIGVMRHADAEFSFAIEGGTSGESPLAAPEPVYVKGALSKADPPAKNLDVAVKAQAKSSTQVQRADVIVSFGENKLTSALTCVGTKSHKSGGWTLDAFSLPAEVVDTHVQGGKPLPVAAFKKETGDRKAPFKIYNVIVSKDVAEAWLAPVAPAMPNVGVAGMSAEGMVKATSVKWEDAKDSKPFLEVTKFEVAKGKGCTIVLAAGKQICTIAIPEPKIQG